jgi:hypothetical protein
LCRQEQKTFHITQKGSGHFEPNAVDTYYTRLPNLFEQKKKTKYDPGPTFLAWEELGVIFSAHNDGLLEEDGEGVDAHQGEVEHNPLGHEGVLRLALLDR